MSNYAATRPNTEISAISRRGATRDAGKTSAPDRDVLAFMGDTMKVARILFVALPLASCADFSGHVAESFSVADVSDNIECQLKAAYLDSVGTQPWLKEWAASYILTLDRQSAASVSPHINWSEPVCGASGSAVLATSNSRNIHVKRTAALADLAKRDCSKGRSGATFEGDLGLHELFDDTMATSGAAAAEPDDFGSKLTFTISGSASASPSWVLTRVPALGFEARASRQATHSLDIAFASTRARPASKVYVVNLGEGGKAIHREGFVPLGGQTLPERAPTRRYTTAPSTRSITPDVRARFDDIFTRMERR